MVIRESDQTYFACGRREASFFVTHVMSLLLVFRPIDRPMFASARSANSISRLSDDMHGADTRTNANAAAMFLNVPRVAKRV